MNDSSSLPPAPVIPVPAPLPAQVLTYAPPGLIAQSRVTVILVRVLGALQLLAGGGGVVTAIAAFSDGDMPLFVTLPIFVAGTAHLLTGIALLFPSPRSWKGVRAVLGALLLPALGFIIFGVVLFVLYHEAKGWDSLSAAVGAAIAIIASAPFWLNLLTLWYLMRPHPRAVFGVSPVDSFIARKTFMRIMLALWVASVVTCVIAWIV